MFCVLGFVVLSHWTITEYRRGLMTPIIPTPYKEKRFLRKERPRAFWVATIWNCVVACVFLVGAFFVDFKL
jgi:hypothetical protein